MQVEYIHPFLESATIVIEQVINVRPVAGEMGVKKLTYADQFVWIQIGMTGQMQGDVVFGLHEDVALRLVSAMMGGFEVTQLDEMSQSAISELGNMISGNASTILYNKGVRVDITPPKIVADSSMASDYSGEAISVPLVIDSIGELDIQVVVKAAA